MKQVNSREDLQEVLEQWKKEGLTWGFVPTMGALHDGHLTLVRTAQQACDRVIVSVFVNPTQFDRASDLEKYPRTLEQDAEKLEHQGTDLLFAPTTEVIYPDGTQAPNTPDLAGIDKRYEGAKRPGHFDGVVQVVRILLELVEPDKLFLGQKDAQQVAILRQAARMEKWKSEIITVPTVREDSGLARSSRNERLSASARTRAAAIYRELKAAQDAYNQDGRSIKDIENTARERLTKAGFEVEYFDFIDAKTFLPLSDVLESENADAQPQIVTAAWIDGIRLIDNLFL